jgi:DNA-binding response OmpR family regulator
MAREPVSSKPYFRPEIRTRIALERARRTFRRLRNISEKLAGRKRQMNGMAQDLDGKFDSKEPGSDSVIGRKTLMVADGDRDMRKIIRSTLYLVGMNKVFEASDGWQVLGMLNNIAVDVIIMDLLVGEIIGLNLIRIIRTSNNRHHRTVPIIVLSGLHDERRVIAARDAGATEFLVKPISPRLLLERLLDVMKHARPLTISDNFIGPDRRRRRLTVSYLGPERRFDTILTSEERSFLTGLSRRRRHRLCGGDGTVQHRDIP